MFVKYLAAALGIAAALITPVAPVQAASWKHIGSRTVSDTLDRDTISGSGDGRFTEIRICAERRAVELHAVVITFGNGERQSIETRRRIGPGACTRSIDLAGMDRFVRNVSFEYQTARANGPQAVVSVYGQR